MSRSVRIAELKANLSAWLRRVKRGESVTVLDRDTPVAQIVPIDRTRSGALQVRRARRPLIDFEPPAPLRLDSDIVALLLEERGER